MPSFFRPVGDLTLRWTYQFAGLDPFYFYVVNIMLHAINSFLIYFFCRIWYGDDSRAHLFSIVAGLIFLTYPSHSEAILWAIGRGVSLATFFSLLAMIIFISKLNSVVKYLLVCLFYFGALACYESAFLLPFVLFTLMFRSSKKQHVVWSLLLLATLFIHLFLRYVYTGGVWQAYNSVIFARDIIQYLSTFIKIILRLFIPPFNHPLLFAIIGGGILLGFVFLLYNNRKRLAKDDLFARTFVMCITGLLVTILVSISFGMSTRTSEGDRLAYLPSVFYAIMVSLLITSIFRGARSVTVAVAVVLVFQTFFLLLNQKNWNRASEYAVKIINRIREHRQRPLYIVNLPSDYKGAYVFRNCLPEALLINKIDSTGVRVVNVVQSTEFEKGRLTIVREKQGENIFIWPNTLLEVKNGKVVRINGDSTVKNSIELSAILYWNKHDLVPLEN